MRNFIVAFIVTMVGLLAYWAYQDQQRPPVPVKKSATPALVFPA